MRSYSASAVGGSAVCFSRNYKTKELYRNKIKELGQHQLIKDILITVIRGEGGVQRFKDRGYTYSASYASLGSFMTESPKCNKSYATANYVYYCNHTLICGLIILGQPVSLICALWLSKVIGDRRFHIRPPKKLSYSYARAFIQFV